MNALAKVVTPTGAMRAWATLLAVIVGFGLALGLTIGYVKKVDADAEHRNLERSREICGLILVLDEAYQATPPTTPLGRNVAAEIHAYRTRLGC